MGISLRRKISFIFFVFIVICSLLWLANDYRNNLLAKKIQIIDSQSTFLNTILEARRYEKNFFLYFELNDLKQAFHYLTLSEKILNKSIKILYNEPALAERLNRSYKKLIQYKSSIEKLLTSQKEFNFSKIDAQNENYPKFQDNIRNLGKQITDDIEKIVKQERFQANTMIKKGRIYLFIMAIVILTMSIVIAFFLFFSVNRPLKSIEHAIKKIVEGDYTNIDIKIKSKEFVSLVTSLNNMINELNKRSEQLIQSKKLASLGTLTSGVAHELNNPLNNISSSIQIVLEELADDNIDFKRELLTEAEKQVDRAKDTIKALLEFSRETTYKPVMVNFKALIDKTVRLIKGEVPTNVKLDINLSDDIQLFVDPQRIQQVLINLILNGVHAMEEKGGMLGIRLCTDTRKTEICFKVHDTGKGIPATHLSKIFDPFFTTKDVGKGSGLGLSVTHGIIEQHGGRIEVDSKVNEGTTFSVFLPTTQSDE
ncbi:integral membrane sensor signal transduction histidine kinase [Candidatus Magnetomorum sp. HK-1]|nr:integral membrane sensor signal transduction histidine kinase [Candidatus Magnetomorum sp. HK-1]